MVRRFLLTSIFMLTIHAGRAVEALPDSLLNFDAVYRYAVVDQVKSLQILQEMRQRRLQPEWQLDLSEGDINFYACKFHTALNCFNKAYESRDVQKSEELQIKVLNCLMNCYDILFDEKNLACVTHDLYVLSESRKDSAHMAMALFMEGKRAHYQGKNEEGYQRCCKAVDMINKSDYWRKYNLLRAFYGELAKMYYRDKNYDEALYFSRLQEKTACQPHQPNVIRIQERALFRTYAIRTNILWSLGRKEEADSIYQRCMSLPITDPFVYRDLVVYLKHTKRFEEMLPFLREAHSILRADGDTINRNTLLLLYDAGDAYQGVGQFEEAARYYADAVRLSDKLNHIHSLQVNESVRESIAVERKLARQDRIQTYVYTAIAFVLLSLAFYFIYSRLIQRKNKLMSQTIHTVMNYRYDLVHNPDDNPDEMDKKVLLDAQNDEDYQRFKQADKKIVKDGLFRQPDFGRDDLMRLMGVDKNAVHTIIKRYTGTNVSGYINTKRMEYAVYLMNAHPEYTLKAISEACGILSSTTFIRNFKEIYDMTPSEFRNSSEITPPK